MPSWLLLAIAIASVLQCGLGRGFEPADFDALDALAALGVQLNRLPGGQLPAAADTDTDTATGCACSFACNALSVAYPGSVAQQGSANYTHLKEGYWSLQQAAVRPSCVFRPTCAEEVAVAVLLSRLIQCPFAVKSGGHAAFAGASNIEGGITIDMGLLNQVTLSEDNTIASLGTGNTWYDVYATLEPKGLAVIGGRVAAIGVGGLILGGGISFFSGLYGWACDNVVNYEVVTAAGRVINANQQSHSDLYWALRGGGNNFGIVTRFDVSAFPQGLMWAGGLTHPAESKDSIIVAFTNFGFNAAEDPKAALILSFAYAEGAYIAEIDIQHVDPVADPPIFDNFTSIPGVLADTTMVRTLSNLTLRFNNSNPGGLRETYWTSAYKLDADLVSFAVDTWMGEIDPIRNVSGLLPACTLQVITTPILRRMSKNGGNALGLTEEGGPLLLLNLNAMWASATDDSCVLQVMANVLAKVDAQAKKTGLYKEYVYMNYASQYQDPMSSYGEENKARLQGIADYYDPKQVFQKLQPGYFKLDGAPEPTCH